MSRNPYRLITAVTAATALLIGGCSVDSAESPDDNFSTVTTTGNPVIPESTVTANLPTDYSKENGEKEKEKKKNDSGKNQEDKKKNNPEKKPGEKKKDLKKGGKKIPRSWRVSDEELASAKDKLGKLKSGVLESMIDYNRVKDFGPAWMDTAKGVAMANNGCRTREDILSRDMSNVKKKDNCTVVSGLLHDPYGKADKPNNHYIKFKRGRKTSSAVQIDHVVALGNAWATGAKKLTQDQREAIANDPLNLLAVDGSENMSKSDRDAANWVPKNKDFHCRYAVTQINVKDKYSLWVTDAERHVLGEMLKTCR